MLGDHAVHEVQLGVQQRIRKDGGQVASEAVGSTTRPAAELAVRHRGSMRCTLNSTETARAFYLANGYIIDGSPDRKHGAGGYPMSKLLTLHKS